MKSIRLSNAIREPFLEPFLKEGKPYNIPMVGSAEVADTMGWK